MAGEQHDPILLAILALVAADRAEQRPDAAVPTEFLLRKAGLSHREIGDIVGEKAGTVQKRLERYDKRAKNA